MTTTMTSNQVSDLVNTNEPLQHGLQAIIGRVVQTGRLAGAPAAHKKLADYAEYAQAIVNSTTTVSDAITAQDLSAFAQALPIFTGQRPKDSELDHRDTNNLIRLSQCLPSAEDKQDYYHLSYTSHAGKLLFVGATNPRAIEWIFMAAILVQRGLTIQIENLLTSRRDRFLEAFQRQFHREDDEVGISPSVVVFSATLQRVISSVITSMKSLDLGELGGELAMTEILTDSFDFDHYVTGDPIIYSVAQEAVALGCEFHDTIKLVHADSDDRRDHRMEQGKESDLELAKQNLDRLRRIEIIKTSPGSSRYYTVNLGPTGRLLHARLVSGLLNCLLSKTLPPVLKEKLLNLISQPRVIHFTPEVDLRTGIAELLVDDPVCKGVVHCPAFSYVADLPLPAQIKDIGGYTELSLIKEVSLLAFDELPYNSGIDREQLIFVCLVVQGWWWSKHLIVDLPERLYIPRHGAYFFAMAQIGATMLHLEQNSGYSITSNTLFDALRFLTNIGGAHDTVSSDCTTYAAQGPGGTLVHDILGPELGWHSNVYLYFRWLRGKFIGMPEVALFGDGIAWRPVLPTIEENIEKLELPQLTRTSITIYADVTEGHCLSCAIVGEDQKIRVLRYSRILCGLLLAYVGDRTKCNHTHPQDEEAFKKKLGIITLPWTTIEQKYFGKAEIVDEDSVMINGVEGFKACQVMALGVSKECTAIDTIGCLECSFSQSSHVIRTGPNVAPA